ncbi:Uncharacterized beta-glucan synthesis-associated protein C23H3.11c [Durusdinium trenchii]|uniref:Uncharacterized beta-glucan synthesis-associated protein C23H3.11c n=1 Tax=Durusdinium trenchii TaxID=1381693 RepID=A0ABP0IV53_9DINO
MRRRRVHSRSRGLWAFVLLPQAVCQSFPGRPGTASTCPKSEWVDPETPSSACASQYDSAGQPLTLVFSDEFNVPGRTFADGHDPAWTAITGFPSNNDQENAYDDSPRHATTSNGNLWLRISNQASRLELVNTSSGKREIKKRPYTSAMLQSWNKFCLTGGVVEMSAKFPGRSDIPGLWPAFWLLGNLGRATVEASNNNVWPFTYSQCPSENLEKANQDPPKQQRINECLGDNWTQRFGLHPHQGRGALEIDILEVLPGNHAPNYKKEKVDTGICKPQTEILYSKLDIPRPHLLNTLQAAPGIPFLADQRPPSPPRLNTTCVPEWGTQWYDGLRPEVPGVYGSSSTINYHNYGKYIVNINPWTDVEIQVDSIGALTGLDEDAFSQHHVYRFEWSTQGDGQLTFWMDGQLLYRLDGKVLAQNMAITKDGEPMGTLLARQLLLEPVSMILNIDVSKQWGWDIIEQNCGGDCGCCLDCGEPECVSCMLEKGGGNEYLHKLCRTLPATYEVDYIRVFQTKDQQAEDRQGCSPKVAPTQGWIDTQRSRYVLPNFDAPLQPVYAGGGRCQTDANCGSNSGSGACSDGVCKCTNGWTGPSCLARMAGAALRCRPLELTLVGGGPCFVNSTHDNCGRGTCIEINRPWDAPWQTVEGLHRFSPVGTGDGRCQCHDGWKGPFCSVESGGQSKTEAKKTDQWDEKTCVPDSSLSSPKLEALITKLCRNWLMGKETIERVSQACSDIDWSSDGKYSQCGSWPRASLVVQAAKEEKGICCTRLDEQGREICFEDEAQFDILLGVATASLALMAVLGCLRQAHLRGGLLSRRSERAAANWV